MRRAGEQPKPRRRVGCAVVATPLLIIRAVEHGDIGFIVGASVFAAAMILLYSASPLSRLAARKAQAYFPYHRTSRNFSPDRRHIHSVLSRHIARWMGRVAPLTIFSITPMAAKPQIIPSSDQPHRFHYSLPAHGLAHRGRSKTILYSPAGIQTIMAGCRRAVLHGGRGLLHD